MPVNYKPFESEFGFKSPFFSVNHLGEITASKLTLTVEVNDSSGFSFGNFTFVGDEILVANQNLAQITHGLATNDIESIGNNLTVTSQKVSLTGSLEIGAYTTTQRDALTATNGQVIYNSETNKLEFYNGSWISTGAADIANFQFTNNTITTSVTGNIIITPSAGQSLVTTDLEADSITTDDAIINNDPISANNAANKGYVDRISAALAIALGS